MPRPAVEVADIFRHRGLAWRASHAGHVSLGQLKVMSAIERCRTAALGGHVERCEDCAHLRIAYNSCRNRHCPKCQAAAAKEWLTDRRAELLPVPYFHVVFTLPGPVADIAYQNKAVVYDLLLKIAAETLITIAADPKHLGARIGLTAVSDITGGWPKRNSGAKSPFPSSTIGPAYVELELPLFRTHRSVRGALADRCVSHAWGDCRAARGAFASSTNNASGNVARHEAAGQLRRHRAPPTAPGRELPAAPVLAGLPRAVAGPGPPASRRVVRKPAGAVPSVKSGRRKQR